MAFIVSQGKVEKAKSREGFRAALGLSSATG